MVKYGGNQNSETEITSNGKHVEISNNCENSQRIVNRNNIVENDEIKTWRNW